MSSYQQRDEVQDKKYENKTENKIDTNQVPTPEGQQEQEELQQQNEQVEDPLDQEPTNAKKESPSAPSYGFFTDILQSSIRIISIIPGLRNIIGITRWFLCNTLQTGPLPHHVAFIMDGNRRYAKYNNMELENGHTAGARTLVGVRICFFL